MADRMRAMSDEELGRALGHLGPALAVPSSPHLHRTVGERLRAGAARTRRAAARRRRRRTVALVLVGALMLAGVAAGLARWRIGAVGVQIAPPRSEPTEVERGPNLGSPATLTEAARALQAPVALPSSAGSPDRVWLDRSFLGRRVVLAWAPNAGFSRIPGTAWGLILMELASRYPGGPELATKDVEPASPPREVTVDGRSGLWIEGPHTLRLQGSHGEIELRVTGNALLWQRGGITYRLESAGSLGTALRLAATVA